MEVKIGFDTEKESVEDLKRLVQALQDLISKREKGNSLGNPLATQKPITMQAPPKQTAVPNVAQTNPQPATDNKNYSGHGRLIEFADMSATMTDIFSGRKL